MVGNDSFSEHAKRVMVMIMIADGTVDDAEIEMIQRLYREISGRILTPREIAAEAGLAAQAGTTAALYAKSIAGSLSEHEQVSLVRVAFLVASATGDLESAQQKQLAELPTALTIPETMFRQVIATASAERQTRMPGGERGAE